MSSVLKEQHRGEEEEEGEAEELAVKTTGPKKVLFVLVSSDRGLCGGACPPPPLPCCGAVRRTAVACVSLMLAATQV